jgi:hypothetical protein
MAYTARLSEMVLPVQAGADIVEGTAVTLSTADTTSGLPTVAVAAENTTTGVFVLMAAPDDFGRPVDSGWYTANPTGELDYFTGYTDPSRTRTMYDVGLSAFWNPTVPSGARAQAHKGGTYAVPSGRFVDAANAKVAGNLLKVNSDGKWEYTASTGACAIVEEYNTTNGCLIFSLL